MANLVLKHIQFVFCRNTSNVCARAIMLYLLRRIIEDYATDFWSWHVTVIFPELFH